MSPEIHFIECIPVFENLTEGTILYTQTNPLTKTLFAMVGKHKIYKQL